MSGDHCQGFADHTHSKPRARSVTAKPGARSSALVVSDNPRRVGARAKGQGASGMGKEAARGAHLDIRSGVGRHHGGHGGKLCGGWCGGW